MLPSVYIETSIVSYLVARPSRDPLMAERQRQTREWWDTRRSDFALFTSNTTLREASVGEPAMARERTSVLAGIALLLMRPEVGVMAEALLERSLLPRRAEADAYHISYAAVYEMNYLLTWNFRHIANPQMYPRIERACLELGFEPPALCTPTELLGR